MYDVYQNRVKLFLFQIKEARAAEQTEKADALNIELKIYLLSKDLTVQDWRNIRTTEYWSTYDMLEHKERRSYVLKTLITYIDSL